jgi:membrane protein YqaA with SNARE-associated domain
MRKIIDAVKKLERFIDCWWYAPLLSTLILADFFVGFIPSDAIVISSTLLRPKRWILYFVMASLGAALGAFLLALAAHDFGEPLLKWIMGVTPFNSTSWHQVESWLEHWGLLGLAFIALGPLPQQPPIIFCALARMPVPEIVLAILIGRSLRYAGLAAVASFAPYWINALRKRWL